LDKRRSDPLFPVYWTRN